MEIISKKYAQLPNNKKKRAIYIQIKNVLTLFKNDAFFTVSMLKLKTI